MTLVALAGAAAVKARAHELGFDRVAIGPATPPDHADAFARWLDDGYAGTMAYLERTRAERLDPRRLVPDARTIVVVALSYKPDAAAEREATVRGWGGVARYARGADYHDVMRPRLVALARSIADLTGSTASRIAADTSALLERDVAARAGLGWVGKNTNLLTEDLGSYFFIGAVITPAELALDAPVADRCGTCRACLDACPTRAFVAPYVLDARRCISYLTIEHRDDIDEPLEPELGDWLFGCDVCQEVCPWNRKAASTAEPAFHPVGRFPSAAEILALDDAAFSARFRGTAVTRTKRRGLLRNAAIVAANRADRSAIPALRQAATDADPAVSGAATRSLARLGVARPPSS